MGGIPQTLAQLDFANLTTTGRKSGLARTIEIWFALDGKPGTIYVLSGGRAQSDWVKNITKEPRVSIELRHRTFAGVARIVEDGEEEDAREAAAGVEVPGLDRGQTAQRLGANFDGGSDRRRRPPAAQARDLLAARRHEVTV